MINVSAPISETVPAVVVVETAVDVPSVAVVVDLIAVCAEAKGVSASVEKRASRVRVDVFIWSLLR